MSKYLKVRGVGRIADNRKVLLVSFNHEPTDEQLREFHDWTSDFKTTEEVNGKGGNGRKRDG